MDVPATLTFARDVIPTTSMSWNVLSPVTLIPFRLSSPRLVLKVSAVVVSIPAIAFKVLSESNTSVEPILKDDAVAIPI